MYGNCHSEGRLIRNEKNFDRIYSWVRCRRLECSQNRLGNPISNGDD